MKIQFTRWCLLRLALAAQQRRAAQRPDLQDFEPSRLHEFQLGRGESTEVAFMPRKPGYIHAHATWITDDENPTAPPLRMQLVRPDGSVAAEAIGCGTLNMHFNLRPGAFQHTRGKTYRVVLSHTVSGQGEASANGVLRAISGMEPLL